MVTKKDIEGLYPQCNVEQVGRKQLFKVEKDRGFKVWFSYRQVIAVETPHYLRVTTSGIVRQLQRTVIL